MLTSPCHKPSTIATDVTLRCHTDALLKRYYQIIKIKIKSIINSSSDELIKVLSLQVIFIYLI